MNFSDVKKGNNYVNLIHYDKNLKKKENFEYYRYFSIKIIGNYSPFDDPEMLKLYISKTNELTQPPHYILMISGMESTEILKEFHEIGFIDDVIIFCFEPNKYVDLKTNYSKVKLISNNFYDVIDFLLSKRHSDRDLNIDSHLLLTPLITYFDYKKGLFPIHRVLSYFFDDIDFFSDNKIKTIKGSTFFGGFNYFSDNNFQIAKKFIEESTYESEIKEKIIKIMEKLRDCDIIDFPKKCIEYYTGEDLCYIFNKALRNFEKFYVEMAHFIGPFYYGIFKYSMKNSEKQLRNKSKTLYRDITMNRLDLYSYQFCENDIICFPSFTSTTVLENYDFKPAKNAKKINNDQIKEKSYVKMIITYNPQGNDCQPQGVDISDISQFNEEQEILLFPFTFLNIDKVEINSGKEDDKHFIYLTIINKGDILEYGLKKKYAFKLVDHGTKIVIDKENNSSCDDNELYYGMSFKYIKDNLF